MKTVLLLIEAFTAIVFAAMSLPLILRKVPPHNWYGVRVKKTLANEDIWYEANASFGKDFLVASIAVLFTCVVLYFLQHSIPHNTFLMIVSTVLLAPYLIAVVKNLLYIRQL